MATRTILTHGNCSLVKYDSGEIRIENEDAGLCSDWLHHTDVSQIKATPSLMDEWNLEESMENCWLIKNEDGLCWSGEEWVRLYQSSGSLAACLWDTRAIAQKEADKVGGTVTVNA